MDVHGRSYGVDQDFDVMKDGSKNTSILKVSFDFLTIFSWLKCLPVKRKYYKFDSCTIYIQYTQKWFITTYCKASGFAFVNIELEDSLYSYSEWYCNSTVEEEDGRLFHSRAGLPKMGDGNGRRSYWKFLWIWWEPWGLTNSRENPSTARRLADQLTA